MRGFNRHDSFFTNLKIGSFFIMTAYITHPSMRYMAAAKPPMPRHF